ncbi:DUF2837 family protein [Alphaproteobacteria bacterium]|nr:DUF2837 family protein [Alphaproteobacteria bacterium]
MNSLILTIVIVSSLSLSITYILTSFTFIIRMIGAINNINAKSWNLASAVLLLNSFFIAISLSMIAFVIDHQPNLNSLLILFVLSILVVLIGHILMIFKFNLTSLLIKKISYLYFKSDLIGNNKINKLNFYQFDPVTFIAWICFLIGFIFPSILAVVFNDYRTTLFQLSFIFNSLGTFLTIVITDKKASLLSDKENPSKVEIKKIVNFLSNVLINRLLATTLVLIVVLILFLLV